MSTGTLRLPRVAPGHAVLLILEKKRSLLEQHGKVVFGAFQSQAVRPIAPRQSYSRRGTEEARER